MNDNYLMHYGVLGMKWGVRRYQDENGHLTKEGRARISKEYSKATKHLVKLNSKAEALNEQTITKKEAKLTNLQNVQAITV